MQCIMITGDNPLTAVHVARDVEIVDRDALILDLKENATHPGGEALVPGVACGAELTRRLRSRLAYGRRAQAHPRRPE